MADRQLSRKIFGEKRIKYTGCSRLKSSRSRKIKQGICALSVPYFMFWGLSRKCLRCVFNDRKERQ
jgi:hypothetical protein